MSKCKICGKEKTTTYSLTLKADGVVVDMETFKMMKKTFGEAALCEDCVKSILRYLATIIVANNGLKQRDLLFFLLLYSPLNYEAR